MYNCRKAMEISKREFDIPMVLEPEYLASPYLDELSGMTYLSYFMKEGSPGFHATLRWVNSQLSHPVQNFTVSEYFLHWYENILRTFFYFRIISYRPIGTTGELYVALSETWVDQLLFTIKSIPILLHGNIIYRWVNSIYV